LGWFRSLRIEGSAIQPVESDKMFILFEGIRHQGQNLLVLIQQQHGSEITQALVGKAGRGEQLQTFNLTEMCPLSQCEEIQQFCNIVPPTPSSALQSIIALRMALRTSRWGHHSPP
jgi:hypothetical protein